ncbi:F-box protein SKIP14-like [Zingiber officinale]|uniref:F-box protein SKIP14-like n=1 Tax=Zingiber officinale TaxID=94328 RepID=UPI001C4BED09|nr:F-box protein SKIP14-like [Zingiber officinale]XP_042385248.1 F-box protein SKIP14-like [Zingiber officinale]
MALNFSSRSMLPVPFVHSDNESYLSVFEGSQICVYPFLSGWEVVNAFDCVVGDNQSLSAIDDVCDPVDLLPDDPFGMELNRNMGAALDGLFKASCRDFFGWSLVCSPETQFNYDARAEELDGWPIESFEGFSVNDSLDEESETGLIDGESLNLYCEDNTHSSGGDEGLPHDGLIFSLRYMDLRDLLSLERVCRSLRSAVRNDSLLWRSMLIDSPLSEKITDDVLLQLTRRAQGNLQSLSLIGCPRITDEGLKCVLDNNLSLKKLHIPGCVRLSLESIINILKEYQSKCSPGIEQLKLGRLFSVSQEQYEELKLLLHTDQHQQPQAQKLRFYYTSRSSLGWVDDRAIDIEMCPLCKKYKLVYDCPSESCQGRGFTQCRACDICIARCIQCGKCIKDCRYVETFCLEYLCSDCWKELQEKF